MQIDGALLATDIRDTGAAARAMEAEGFDGILSFEGAHDPFLPLAAAAEHTDARPPHDRHRHRVRAQPHGVRLPRERPPAPLAADASSSASARRSARTSRSDSARRGRKPNARMREFVQAIRAIWRAWDTGERLEFRGAFYTHTLMTPFFSPGPNPHGRPPIALAGFGPAMIAVAGEVADGWIVHPLNSPSYVEAVGLPALARGLARAGRARRDVEIACQTIAMIGSTDDEIAAARMKAKGQIAFYGSTPAYRVMLDHHGWGAPAARAEPHVEAGAVVRDDRARHRRHARRDRRRADGRPKSAAACASATRGPTAPASSSTTRPLRRRWPISSARSRSLTDDLPGPAGADCRRHRRAHARSPERTERLLRCDGRVAGARLSRMRRSRRRARRHPHRRRHRPFASARISAPAPTPSRGARSRSSAPIRSRSPPGRCANP